MCFLLWASQIKTTQLLSQCSAVRCLHAQTPTNLVDGLIMDGKHKIMPKHGGLQELMEGGSHGSSHSSFVFILKAPTFSPPNTLYINGVLTTLLWKYSQRTDQSDVRLNRKRRWLPVQSLWEADVICSCCTAFVTNYWTYLILSHRSMLVSCSLAVIVLVVFKPRRFGKINQLAQVHKEKWTYYKVTVKMTHLYDFRDVNNIKVAQPFITSPN